MRRPGVAAKLREVIRCLIVDDNAPFLDAATRLLERDAVAVVGTARTVEQALRRTRELQPDAVLVDIMLGDESGFEVARRIAENGLDTAVILISTHAEADLAELIDESPAAGFVSKSQLSAATVRGLVTERRDM